MVGIICPLVVIMITDLSKYVGPCPHVPQCSDSLGWTNQVLYWDQFSTFLRLRSSRSLQKIPLVISLFCTLAFLSIVGPNGPSVQYFV